MNRNASRGTMTILTLLLLIGALLTAGILGEVWLRMLGYSGAPESHIGNIRLVDDPILNWRFIPHSKVQDGKVVVAYNGAGFRDRDHKLKKPPGVRRVVIVGDSVTEGSGVEADEIFSTRLQRLLGPQYEVINLGMSGLNTPQEVHILDVEGLDYDPDVVILNFVLNDCDFFSEFHAAKQFVQDKDAKIGLFGDISIDPRIKRLLKSSALIYFVKSRVENLVGMITGKGEANYYQNLWRQDYCYQRIAEGFDKLQDLHIMKAFDVHVLIWPLVVNYKPYAFTPMHNRVKGEAEARGFKVLDLLDVFASVSYRDLQVTAEDNVHPNGKGHQLAVEAYMTWARELGLFDK